MVRLPIRCAWAFQRVASSRASPSLSSNPAIQAMPLSAFPKIKILEIDERPQIMTWIVTKAGTARSRYGTAFIELLGQEMASRVDSTV